MFHELLTATPDLAVLPGVLGCCTLRRIPRSAGHAHLRGLVTLIHETSELEGSWGLNVLTGGYSE